MHPLHFIKGYHSLFGARGVWLAAQARLWRRSIEVAVAVPGIKHPVHLRLRTSDVATFRQVLVEAGYDCNFVRPPRTIVDAGANIGLTSVFYANRYPDATILAIEPEQANYNLLKKNTAPYQKIIPVQGALWKSNEELNIVNPGSGAWGFQTTAEATEVGIGGAQGKSRGMTVDLLMKEHAIDRIDLLKIDIEGSEKEVFENAVTWIETVGAIEIELHDGIRPGCSDAFYSATSGFGTMHRRGETVFVSRRGLVLGEQSVQRSDSQGTGKTSVIPQLGLPCRIIEAVDC